ncbi:type II toxin-antitoxin system HicB family antitoxin [Bacillus subtilis]|nr:type II toxin-antitoxin system HicB family antitoxin [Bacillus subtilis]MED3474661.1 type II toxin-antitoxin system HicB family antitoxin [Bacillus subtilis]
MINQVIYPAVFYYDSDGITVTFPDLKGCVTCGSDEKEAIKMAKEAMGLHLYGMEQDLEEFPEPSKISDIKIESNEMVCLIEVYMNAFRHEYNKSYTKKTLTIPTWIEEIARERRVNFSQVLQDALKEYLGI